MESPKLLKDKKDEKLPVRIEQVVSKIIKYDNNITDIIEIVIPILHHKKLLNIDIQNYTSDKFKEIIIDNKYFKIYNDFNNSRFDIKDYKSYNYSYNNRSNNKNIKRSFTIKVWYKSLGKVQK